MKNRKGFTITELVIVIAVIAILAAVLIPTFSSIIGKANNSAALQEARSYYTEYTSEWDYTTGSPEQNLVIKTKDDKYLAVKGAQMQDDIYATADEAATAAGLTAKANPNPEPAGYTGNDYLEISKASNAIVQTWRDFE